MRLSFAFPRIQFGQWHHDINTHTHTCMSLFSGLPGPLACFSEYSYPRLRLKGSHFVVISIWFIYKMSRIGTEKRVPSTHVK